VSTPRTPNAPERLPQSDPRRQRTAVAATVRPALAVPPDGSAPPTPAAAPAPTLVPYASDDDDDFVDPEATKKLGEEYGLPPGKWILVRSGLSWAQEQKLQMDMIGGRIPADALNNQGEVDLSKVQIDTVAVNIATLKTWIVDWNLTHKGERLPIDEGHLGALNPARAAQLMAAVQKHIAEVREGNATRPPSPDGG
jgi:hypothetical protein